LLTPNRKRIRRAFFVPHIPFSGVNAPAGEKSKIKPISEIHKDIYISTHTEHIDSIIDRYTGLKLIDSTRIVLSTAS